MTETLRLALEASALSGYREAVQAARSEGNAAGGADWYAAGSAAIVPISGALNKSLNAPEFGVRSYSAIISAFNRAYADPDSRAVVLHIASSGGDVSGLFAAVDHIAAVRGGEKPVIALVDEHALSAGYALASAADQIVLASETGQVGSVGVVAAHVDLSAAEEKAGVRVSLVKAGARKTDGNPHEPLSEEARADLQADVDRLHSMFVERVAKHRQISQAAVRGQEARVYRGASAVEAGLADAVMEPGRLLAAIENLQDGDSSMNLRDLSGGAKPTAAASAGDGTDPNDDNRLASVADVQGLARSFGLDANQTLGLIDYAVEKKSVGTLRDAVMEAKAAADDVTQIMTQRPVDPNAGVTGMGGATIPGSHNSRTMDNPAAFADAAGEALTVRRNPGAQISEPARQFAGMGLTDMARATLQRNGRNAVGSRAQIVASALHSTSDFPAILESYARRTLADAYRAAPSGIRQVAKETSAEDFRAIKRLNLGEFPPLQEVGEAGEFHAGTVSERGESYAVKTFGRIIGITRQSLVNDDLNAFDDLARRAGQSARDLEAGILADLLKTNPVMSDGEAFFSTAHANIAGTGSSIADGLSAARQAMRSQTGLDGEQIIDATPAVLLVGADRETEAEKALAAVQPTNAADFNPFSNLRLAVDPRLNGWGWALFAEPTQLAALEFAYLGGARAPEIVTENGFNVDALRMRVRHDFGAGLIEPRAAFKNAG